MLVSGTLSSFDGWGKMIRKRSRAVSTMLRDRLAEAGGVHVCGTPQFELIGRHWSRVTMIEAKRQANEYAQST
jgi:hypothetical protein